MATENKSLRKQHKKSDACYKNVDENLEKRGNRVFLGLTICAALLIFIIVGNVVKYEELYDHYKVESRKHSKSLNKNTQRVSIKSHIEKRDILSKPWRRNRLPPDTRPKHYDMFIQVNFKELKFSGKSNISLMVTKSTKSIIFHINKLLIKNIQIFNLSYSKSFKIKHQFGYKKNQYFVVKLVDELKVGEYALVLNFDGDIETKELNGFYKSTYETKDGETRVLAVTDFEPADARKAFPCFDEPAMKATFTISIEHNNEYKALSNMNVVSIERASTTTTLTKFAKSVPMPTYLVAYLISDFRHLNTTMGNHNNITIRTWAEPGQHLDSAYALDIGKRITTFYEKYYGVPYPLPKQDMIAVPDFNSGGMENWGIIMYKELSLLFKHGVSSTYDKEKITHVVAHELAHMWFGNLVSCLWWNDLWLNEGFASYVQYLGTSHAQPDWNYLDTFLINHLYPAFRMDALASSHPISVHVADPSDIITIFDSITYKKGASIIRMLSDFLGETVFKKGVKYYLEKHMFGNAESKDLWNALSTVSCINISRIMDSWTTQMGFPVVHVFRNGSGKGKAVQKHFLLNPNSPIPKKSGLHRKSWYVPFNYIIEGDTKKKRSFWMNKTSATFDWPNGKWLKANFNQRGYYRVNYDKDNWERLSSVLKNDHEYLAPSDRASLIDDVLMLARAGQLDYNTAFNLVSYVPKEKKYVPWKAFLDNMAYLKKMLRKEDIYEQLQKFLLNIVKRRADILGWKKTSNDSYSDIQLRSSILDAACSFAHQNCIKNVKKVGYLNDEEEVDVDLKDVIYYHGIANTGTKEWEKLFDIFQNTSMASKRSKLLHSLSASKNHVILQRFLNYSIDKSKFRSQETVAVLNKVAYNPIGQTLAWNFFKQNWNVFYRRYSKSSFQMASMISSTTSNMKTKTELEEVQNFFKGRDTGSGTRAVNVAIENIMANINWMENSAPQIEEYLESLNKNFS